MDTANSSSTIQITTLWNRNIMASLLKIFYVHKFLVGIRRMQNVCDDTNEREVCNNDRMSIVSSQQQVMACNSPGPERGSIFASK